MRSMLNNSVNKRNVMAFVTSTSNLNPNMATEINKEQQPTTHLLFTLKTPRHLINYESAILVYSLAQAFSLKLLYLYSTVWWFPQTYKQNEMV